MRQQFVVVLVVTLEGATPQEVREAPHWIKSAGPRIEGLIGPYLVDPDTEDDASVGVSVVAVGECP